MSPSVEATLHTVRDKRDLSCFDLYSIDQLQQSDSQLIFDVASFSRDKNYKVDLGKGNLK